MTTLSKGRRTTVPKRVVEALGLRPTPDKKEKLLWTLEGGEIVVTKGTPQSSFKKTKLATDGTAAVPKHVREFLKLESTLHKEETMIWVQKGDWIVVRKGIPRSGLAG
jgi:bifunctional DNA-binding transcriptional regulator/antitoxin component of YhaV-PrlF toxin-antitoxin module